MKKPLDSQLVTTRLELVPITPADLGELHALYTDPDVRRHLWDDLVIDQLETDNVVRQSLRSFRTHGYGLWRVQRRGEAALVGCCGLREVGTEAELVVAVTPRLQRQGYAREAALAVLCFALHRLRLRRVVAMCDLDNVASRALLASLGMREQHVTRASGFERTVDVLLHEATAADVTATGPLVATRAS